MAIVDPRTHKMIADTALSGRYELRIHDIAPEDIVPNGDRYVVEVIDIDEKVLLGQLLIVTQAEAPKDPNNPMADPQVERRGVLAAVIVSVGNGHLLGLPDPKLVVGGEQNSWVQRESADVPMFFSPGDVVFVDHNAKGRALQILKRECRIVNQIDILGSVPKLRLKHTDDGWQPE